MSRLVFLSIAVVLSLLPVVAPAEPVHKRPAPRWHGYGFLPGYQQPPNNSHSALRPESFGFAHGAPQPAPLVYRSSPTILRVRRRLALFRPAWLLRRPLQWRQLRPVLDADADRAGLELRLIKPSLKDRALRIRLPAVAVHGAERTFAETLDVMLCFLHVRCSANRAGDPIVAEKRPDYYAINYPELQARIEIAHRPLIEVNDAARR